MKFIYLIKSDIDGYYKIGISNNPQKRLKQLSTGNSSQLTLIESYRTSIPFQIENALHRKYSQLKMNGEWFRLSLEEELNFKKNCELIENGILILKKMNNIFV